MDDIVERLRVLHADELVHVEYLRNLGDQAAERQSLADAASLAEAADNIDRQREEIKHLREALNAAATLIDEAVKARSDTTSERSEDAPTPTGDS